MTETGNQIEVEGTDDELRIVAQVIGNRGTYKAAYRNKVLADLFKLAWVRQSLSSVEIAVLVVTDAVVPALAGWVPQAAADMGIDVLLIGDAEIVALDGTVYPPAIRGGG
ncbi:hypothetical protein ACX9R5_16650 [Rathayibacter sp. CAU 1779]